MARYVTEGHLADQVVMRGFNEVVADVRREIDANPEVLDRNYTNEERTERDRARREQADEFARQIPEAEQAGDWDRALQLVDQAERAAPGYQDYDRARQIIRERRDSR